MEIQIRMDVLLILRQSLSRSRIFNRTFDSGTNDASLGIIIPTLASNYFISDLMIFSYVVENNFALEEKH